jgi:hypothetical protein
MRSRASLDTVVNIEFSTPAGGGHAVMWWSRHYAASRKVAGSSPDEVDFFKFT